MLKQVTDRPEHSGRRSSLSDGSEAGGDLTFILGALRRQRRAIVLAVIFVVALAVVYLRTATPVYRSEAAIMLDARRLDQGNNATFGPIAIDVGNVESQVESVKSERLARKVVEAEKLYEDVEFVGDGKPPFSILGLVGMAPEVKVPTTEEKIQAAVFNFRRKLGVLRAGFAYAINIEFESRDPEKAARLANKIAEAYIQDQLDSKYEATHRLSMWMQDRIKELDETSSSAEKAILDYKLKNRLIVADGKLVDGQQITDLSTQLGRARTTTEEARGKLNRIQDLNAAPGAVAGGAVTETLTSDVITKLRQEYLTKQQRMGDLAGRYGARHELVLNLQSEMRQTEKAIRDELGRIQDTYRNDFEVAKAREASVEKRLNDLARTTAVTEESQIELRSLESTARTYRTLYDTFLSRYTQIMQQQSFPITEARVISAGVKGEKSWPKSTIVLAGGVVGGLVLGLLIAFIREMLDRVVRTRKQLVQIAGVECLGMLPRLPALPSPAARRKPQGILGQTRFIEPVDRRYNYVAASPFSTFAETIRSIKMAADAYRPPHKGQVIGLVSAVPGEGKSTVSANLAALVAQSGRKTLLVDCDLKNPSLSRALTPNAQRNVVQLVKRETKLEDTIWTDRVTGFHFVPALAKERHSQTAELISSEAMKAFFEEMIDIYECVVVDLPPILAVVDVRAASPLIDHFVMVVEWGATKIDIINEALASPSAQEMNEKLLGTVLNKVDEKMVRRFGAYTDTEYASKYFEN